jgi:hypothetical protein
LTSYGFAFGNILLFLGINFAGGRVFLTSLLWSNDSQFIDDSFWRDMIWSPFISMEGMQMVVVGGGRSHDVINLSIVGMQMVVVGG